MKCDVLIVGGGTGGSAAAAALKGRGLTVVLTEETDCLGGQFTSQCVPPDEHPWIEQFGCTRRYREFRYRARRSALTRTSRADLSPYDGGFNPGQGWVSRLCTLPSDFALAFRTQLESGPVVGPDSEGSLLVLLRHVATAAMTDGCTVRAVHVRNVATGEEQWIEPRFVLDATETGDLLPMTGTEWTLGAESKDETGEPHAVDGPAQPDNVQAFTWCAAIEWDGSGADHTIAEPEDYGFWREFVPPHWTGRLLDLTFPNVRTGEPMTLPLFEPEDGEVSTYRSGGPLTLFGYRQIVSQSQGIQGSNPVTVMNWPQNDYMTGSIVEVDGASREAHLRGSRQLTLSVLYWLQTETGFRGLRLRPDVTGTRDGLAKAPYIREGRRIKSLTTVLEQDVAVDCNPGRDRARDVADSVGVGAYRIDLHPAVNGAATIDIGALPFQIPLGALVPKETANLLPACKNIGTTHVTNGCFRLHPVEWNIGESAGLLALFCIVHGVPPQAVHASPALLAEFQGLLIREGIETEWPRLGPL
ncbi:MAG: FAD-dependent oxidoreductase [Armatimonadetes bacterium]|nr:FAD-dependent oxidoreductase [Armatimonadota bacterium]